MDTYGRLVHVTLLFIVVHFDATSADAGFIYTMPRILRSGSTSEFCLTMHGYAQPSVPVTMSLMESESGTMAVTINDLYTTGGPKCNGFLVPSPGDYELLLYNETDILHDSVKVTILGDKLITFVQTDKPMYKPGQKVKFRILTLLKDLKPRVGKIRKVFILDPNEIRVKQYLDVETQGISSLEFQLAKEAKLGKWNIEVLVDEHDEKHKQVTFGEFEVKEYVLPRFEVVIKPPAYLLGNQEILEGQVCAKYTYGKPVTGYLDLKTCWGSSYGPPSSSCAHEVIKISGCHNFSVNVTDLKGPGHYAFFGERPQFKASVTEEGTGAVVNASVFGPTETFEPLQLQLDDYTNGFFKPGLPFYGKVTATRPDGSPAEGELILITATDAKNNLKFSRNYTTDSSGVIVYSLCGGFTENTSSIAIDAAAARYSEQSDPEIKGLYTPRGYVQITQWFSPSLSYIQIPRMDSSHSCGESLTLSIPFTTRANTAIDFHYQVMTRGEVLETGRISYNASTKYPSIDPMPSKICLLREELPVTPPPPATTDEAEESSEGEEDASQKEPETASEELQPPPPPVQNTFTRIEQPILEDFQEPIVRSEMISDTKSDFLLHLTIKPVMSPKFTLLVYYVRPDGEVVADSMQYEVTPCFDNEVKMDFNQTMVLPGEEVDIKLTASPGSVCGVGIVDKSINILGGKHQITPEMVFEKVEEFNSAHYGDISVRYRSDDDYCEQRIKDLQGDETLENDREYWHYASPYVDAIQAFKASGFMVLSNLNLETRPCGRSFPVFYYDITWRKNGLGRMPAPEVGSPIPLHKGPSLSKTSVRTHFPETWLWDLHIIGESGENVLTTPAPHTITSWVGNAMCMDQKKGFGISELTSLTTFQPFFLSLHLPYAAIRGERLPLLVTVHNYLEKCLHIQISLDMGENFKLHNRRDHRAPVCVCGGDSYTAKFYVTPTEIGHLPVIAKAEIIPGLCGNKVDVDLEYVGVSDTVKRQMFVKVEGVEQQYSHSTYICAKDGQPKEEKVILPLPDDGEMVKDSARGELQVVGDIMGPALTNLDNLVKMPTGCGEQNMVGFVPNIFVLKYLENTGRLTEEVHDKAIKFMEIGYQRELSYRHRDGSFSAFGNNDPEGSVWLTAFVVKSFAQARSYIYIDEKDMAISLKFLRRSQLETGCFRETGKVFSSYMMGGLGRGKKTETNTALTAYVLIALLTANVSTSETVITSAVKCMKRDFEREQEKMDPYTLALVAYANALYQPNSRISIELVQVLESKARKDGPLKFWSRETPKPKAKNTWYYYAASSAEVEMTGYALMAYLTFFGQNAIERSYEIAMWLSKQRNPYGGFASTQDTVVGLNALSEFASVTYLEGGRELEVTVTGKKMNEAISVSDKEATTLLLQTAPIQVLPNLVTITAEGVGCALVQSSVRYNKLPKDLQAGEKPSFHLKVSPRLYQHDIDRCDRRTISISVGTKGRQKYSNGMVLVTVKMVTSWSPMAKSLTKLESLFPVLGMKKVEHDEEKGVLTLYFDELSKRPKIFSIDVEQDRELAVSNPKPAQVKVFQYYETDVSHIQSYKLKTICGTKAEIPHKQPEDPNLPFVAQVRVDLTRTAPAGSPGESADGCPVCVPLKIEPKNFKAVVCNSTAVYKTFAGRSGTMPLKLRHNLRPRKTQRNVNIFAKYKMPIGCDCSLLEKPLKRVLVLVRKNVSKRLLMLDDTSLVILTNKRLEKQVRKYRRSCPLDAGNL